MDKINFENLPSTNTPINADNLNQLQINIENAIRESVKSEIYYSSGDNVTLTYSTGGFLTTGATEIQFSIPLPKRMNNVNPTIESGYLYARKPEGGYLLNNVSITLDNTVTLTIVENLLRIQLLYNTAFEATNNIPLGIQIRELKINFN